MKAPLNFQRDRFFSLFSPRKNKNSHCITPFHAFNQLSSYHDVIQQFLLWLVSRPTGTECRLIPERSKFSVKDEDKGFDIERSHVHRYNHKKCVNHALFLLFIESQIIICTLMFTTSDTKAICSTSTLAEE